MEELLCTPLCHILWINQMGYIKVNLNAQLPGIHGNVNQPESEGVARGQGWFTLP